MLESGHGSIPRCLHGSGRTIRQRRTRCGPSSTGGPSGVVTVLLDENFPLGLVRVLEADGLKVEHIITLGWRGVSDAGVLKLNDDGALVPRSPGESKR